MQVKFETIKQIDFAATAGLDAPMSTITLSSGEKGEFQLAISGGFKGQSEFGEVHIPASAIKRVLFK